MPQRNSTIRKRFAGTTSLRRSPRLLSNNRSAPEDSKTPFTKSKTKRISSSDRSPLSSPCNRIHKPFPKEASRKFEDSKSGSKFSQKLNTGSLLSAASKGGVPLRRSPRFSGNAYDPVKFVKNTSPCKSYSKRLSDFNEAEEIINPQEGNVAKIEKRVTRSSSRRNPDERNGFVESTSIDISNIEDSAKVTANSCTQIGGKLDRRVTRSSGADVDKRNGSADICSEIVDNGTKLIGAKRKRGEVEEGGHATVQGWTKDQELALQRAYYAANPTPHFWKKVAKLVPGKSAQDCFDKIHADQLTPLQPRNHSRASKTCISSFAPSESTLLKLAKPRRPSGHVRKSHLTQKTIRHLLEKQYNVDQNSEADLFSILEESTFSSSTGTILCTPERDGKKPGYLKKCHERSSSARRKHISRLSNSNGTILVSPPVLKQVKNKALHEKYIDQLHFREAKRRSALAKEPKLMPGKEERKEGYIQHTGIIKAAKNALVFDAKDIIHQFQHLKASPVSNSSDFDDDGVERDDDEKEDEL